MNDANLSFLFADPLYSVNIAEHVESNLLELLTEVLSTDLRNNDKNKVSNNDQIFDSVLADTKLVQVIEQQLAVYKHNIMGYGDKIDLKITQSWLNYNRAGESHHRHNHPNSIISGVFYVQLDPDASEFIVHRPMNSAALIIDPLPEYRTEWNSDHMICNPKVGDLYLFKSQTLHSVSQNRSSVPRISLSFNTFFHGDFYAGTNKLARLRLDVSV